MIFDELVDDVRAAGHGAQALSPANPAANPALFEAAFWVLVLLMAALVTRLRPDWAQRVEHVWIRISRHRRRCIAGIFLAAIVLRLALLPWIPVPTPWVHDEFSYLLQGQMFASGHITEPTPAAWHFLEAYHVNLVPTYQSMYPPVSGIFIAIGFLVGLPWFGVILPCALMCAATTWALQAWVPPHWALAGGAYTVLRYALFSYWMNSYVGGSSAGLAGALLLGVVGRILKKPTPFLGLTGVVAILMLANTRPYEGLLYSFPLTVWILYALLFRPDWKRTFVRVLLPSAAVLACGFLAMGYYNHRSTGHAAVMPYTVNFEQYHLVRPFFWQKRLSLPDYRHGEMRRMYVEWELPSRLMVDYPEGREILWRERIWTYYMAYFWPLGILFIPAFWMLVRHRRMRPVAAAIALVFLGLMLVVWHPQSQYAAPCMAATLVLNITGLRWLRGTLRRHHTGLHLSRAAVLVMLSFLIYKVGHEMTDPQHFWNSTRAIIWSQFERERIVAQLQRRPTPQMVIVHAPSTYIDHNSWIANEPDIERSHIIFARDMGHDLNRQLLAAYPNRQVSYIDYEQPFLRPYAGVDDTSAAANESAAMAMLRQATTAQAFAFPELLVKDRGARASAPQKTMQLHAEKSR